MRVPFQKVLDDLFKSDRSILLKIVGAGFVVGFLFLAIALKGARNVQRHWDLTTNQQIVWTGVCAAVGAFLALVLSLKDIVIRRIECGADVNPIMRLYFGEGGKSLAIWFVSITIFTIFITIAIAFF